MAYPITVFPDSALTLIQYLRSRTEVTSLIPANRITTVTPPNPEFPLVTVQVIGGSTITRQWIDEPSFQVTVVGSPEAEYECSRIIRTITGAILAIANDSVDEGVLVSASEEVGPQWFPDITVTPPLAQFIAHFAVIMHPHP